MTDVPEGTIVRVITRLDETCREVRDAARVIGDADLFAKMEEAQGLIKRDSEFSSWIARCHVDGVQSSSLPVCIYSYGVYLASIRPYSCIYKISTGHRILSAVPTE